MLKRDFLLAQINKLSETIFRILLDIEKNNLVEAEEMIQQNFNSELLDDYLKNEMLPEDKLQYETLLFQLELLYTKLKLLTAKGEALKELKEKYLKIARLVQSQQKNFNLSLQQRIAEVAGF